MIRSCNNLNAYLRQKNTFIAIVLTIWGVAGGTAALGQERLPAQTGEDLKLAVPAALPDTSAPADILDSAEVSVAMPSFTPAEQLDDAHDRFLDFYADGLYPQSLVAAQQTLKLTGEIYGYESLEVALALVNVATAQSKTGELQGAVANYEASVRIIEEHEGIVSPRLINPLMGLAATQNKMGAFDRGLKTHTRALRLNHVELGLNNSSQMRIRDGLTESYLGLDDKEDANFQQEIQLRITRQEQAGDIDALLPAVYKLAGWYRRSNQPEQETLLLQSAVRSIKKSVGNDSKEQIRMLRNLAAAHQRLDMPSEAMRLLKRAWKINAGSETRDPLLGAEIEVEIGDYYNGSNSQRNALRYYTLAWETLTTEGGDESTRLLEDYFGTPVNIWSMQLPDIYPLNTKTAKLTAESPDLFREGFLIAEYDVSQNGRTDNIRIIESDPEGLLDKRVVSLLGRYFYRPRFENGIAVATESLQLRHRFIYLPDAAAPAAEKKARDTDGRIEYPGGIN